MKVSQTLSDTRLLNDIVDKIEEQLEEGEMTIELYRSDAEKVVEKLKYWISHVLDLDVPGAD